MYKIMLADDEGIVIDSLKFIIEKNFEGICITDFAKTGRSVIELAERFRPDIVFMDIQMPGINGIEAMREIKRFSPSTVFIVLSAYDKFDYAKEAIHLGVLEYLNKPVNQKVIVEIIQKAMQIIDNEKEKRSYDLLVKEKLEIVVPSIEAGLIYAILFQEECPEDMVKYNELLGVKEQYGYLMVLEYGDTVEGTDLSNTVGASIKAQSFSYHLREIVKEYVAGVVGANMTNKTIVFIPCNQSQIDYNERMKIIENGRQMIRTLTQKIDVEFRLGIGDIKSQSRLVESYREAISAMRNSSGTVVHFKDLPLSCMYEENYPIETEQALFSNIRLGKLSEAKVEADTYFDWMIRNYSDCEMDIKLKVLELVLYGERKAYLSGGMTYTFTNRKDYLSTIIEMHTYEELKKWFVQKICEACTNVLTKKNEHSNQCIEKAKAYIKEHYKKDISLEEVSRKVDISLYYFSKLFKNVVGENFIDYLTRIRIEAAKALLYDEMSIKEVALEVGYRDSNYFSRLFKKCVGITPTEFKEGIVYDKKK
ncbi:response regulator [Cellulosilyticum sp. I15G10I2]|uniref:response regulator n=1 Tax=Cellulosilyticum sp. I15G10I2 TaxID=1892843 RepID=UPI00085C4F4A|nr:response regulator [Cellulosilyticum sp. I15G10I2]